MMNKILPYYGKAGSIRSVKQIDDINFEVETYKDNGNSSVNSKVTVIKEHLLKNYLTDIKEYLDEYYDDYIEYKDNIDNKRELKKNILYLVGGIVGLIGIPFLAITLQMNNFISGITVINTLLMLPTVIQSSKELIYKYTINEMKNLISEYESVLEEEKEVELELEQICSKKETKFTSIKPKKQEVKDKKLIKEKVL